MKATELLLMFLSLLFIDPLFSQVDFSASETEGCGTLDVDFTNESNPSGSTFYWDFGNGQIQRLKTPQ